ncbi:conserved hypothetical protein [delta proteobacterium NaphS2]|nr:conserved hypothetical protein [delta proteobacterium NaphS2]
MKTEEGWFVLYQPQYKAPCVFDLHERGLFEARPTVTKEYGARFLVGEDLNLKLQYLHLVEKSEKQGNTNYTHVLENGFVQLNEDLSIDESALTEAVPTSMVRDEIVAVWKEWFGNYVPLDEKGKVDDGALKKKLSESLNTQKQRLREFLVRKNGKWIYPFLPRMVFDFHHGLYQRMSDRLYPEYRARGGKDTEKGLIEKIHMFDRICESEDPDTFLKPDGTQWKGKDEIWDCWVGLAGSKAEADRICATLEVVLPPISEALARELES